MEAEFRTSHRKTFSGVDSPDSPVLSLPSLLRPLVVCSKWVVLGQPLLEIPWLEKCNNNKTSDFSEVFSRLDSNLVPRVSKLLPNPLPLDTPFSKVVNWPSMLLTLPSEIDSVSKEKITET